MRPTKKIYDSVHRFIHIDSLESDLINTRPFQRLHYIHQLGVTYFVYPGATHRRFEHSLGVMELASRIYDEITREAATASLPGEYQTEVLEKIPAQGSLEYGYWRRILRFGALCHDLGHLPFSHTAEHELLGDIGHEGWTRKIIESHYLAPIWEQLESEYRKEGMHVDAKRDVMKLSLGEKKFRDFCDNHYIFTPWERIVTEIITGDFFGSDRIDYLLRDSKCTGLAYGLFDYHQLIEMLKILPTDSSNLALGIEENGIESCEALLLARHYMHKRIYQYPTVKAYSFHMARFMGQIYYDLSDDLERYVNMTDNEVLADLNRASLDSSHPGHFDAKCLYLRKNRFQAIPLQIPPDESELKKLQERFSIPSQEMSWKIAKKNEERQGLSFPVLCKDGTVDTGTNLSEIFVPGKNRSWIFISPQYEKLIRQNLEGALR